MRSKKVNTAEATGRVAHKVKEMLSPGTGDGLLLGCRIAPEYAE